MYSFLCSTVIWSLLTLPTTPQITLNIQTRLRKQDTDLFHSVLRNIRIQAESFFL